MVDSLTEQRKIIVELSPAKEIDRDCQRTYNGGYLFLQLVYHELGLNKICNKISKKYKFQYDLNGILSRLLLVYRILEKNICKSYSCEKLVETLSEMNFLCIKGEGFIPTYTRTQLTDFLHDAAGFNTDRQIITKQNMKNIIKITKK